MAEEAVHAYLEAAEEVARKAGQLLLRWDRPLEVRTKGPSDLVTNADLACQQLIRETLSRRCPGIGFVGEEEPSSSVPQAWQWVVDPLDGTTNYTHGVPFYSVSIALLYGSEVLVGVVYDPVRDECFRAARGDGAWLNAQALKVSSIASLPQALVVTSFPPAIERSDEQVEFFIRVLTRSQSVRRTGSAALNLAYVAAGRFDAFWSTSMHPWDVAAGVLLVREAGGRCTDLDGHEASVPTPRLLATNGGPLHDQMREVLHQG